MCDFAFRVTSVIILASLVPKNIVSGCRWGASRKNLPLVFAFKCQVCQCAETIQIQVYSIIRSTECPLGIDDQRES